MSSIGFYTRLKSFLILLPLSLGAGQIAAETFTVRMTFSTPVKGADALQALPTPVRIIAEADFKAVVRTGFGNPNQFSNFVPLVSVMEGQEDNSQDFQSLFDVLPNETQKQKSVRFGKIQERRTRTLLNNKIEVKASLKRGREFYLELGGLNVLADVKETRLRKFDTPAKGNLIEIVVPVVQFPNSDRENVVRYRFFKYNYQLVASAESVPSAQVNNSDEYFKSILFRNEGDKIVAGSENPKTAPRKAYVFSTCAEFRDLGGPNTKAVLDSKSSCWIYDLKQMNEVLPLTGEDHSKAGSYLVVREASDSQGKSKAPVYTLIDTFKNSFSILPSLSSWTAL